MEDNCNAGGTIYKDKNGKELTEKEYRKKQNTAAPTAANDQPVGEKEVMENVD